MASKAAIGRVQAEAMQRLAAATLKLSEVLQVPHVNLATIRDRDPSYQAALRLKALADWADHLVGAIEKGQEQQRVPKRKPARKPAAKTED